MSPPRLSSAAALLLATCTTAWASPGAEHAATCVAALQREAQALSAQLRSGRVEVEPELRRRLQQGFAFVGVAYKQGLRQEEADRLLHAAEEAQEHLSEAELSKRQAECRAEGTELLARANVVEQALVERAADRRLQKLKRTIEPHSRTAVPGTAS